MKQSIVTIFVVVITLSAISSSLWAQCDTCGGGCAAACCSKVCVGKAEMVDVEKHCWEVECEEVCIPAVRFPWEPGGNKLTIGTLFPFKCDKGCNNPGCDKACCDGSCDNVPTCGCAGAGCATCCPPKCGFVVAVRDLKKKTYTEQACVYSISLEHRSAGCCDKCSNPGCTGCGAAPANVGAPLAADAAYRSPSTARVVRPAPRPTKKSPAAKLGTLRNAGFQFANLKSLFRSQQRRD